MKTEKLLLRIDTDRQVQMERMANNAADSYNKLMDHCKSIEIEMPSDIAVKLVKSEMQESIIDDFVFSLFLDYPEQFAKEARQRAKDEIMEFEIFRLDRNFEFVDFIKNKAILKEETLKEIKKICSIYLIDPQAIERYKRLEKWVDEGTAIWRELEPFNPVHPYLLTLPHKDGGYCINVNNLNFTK